MLALLLAFGVFLFLTFVGKAVLEVLRYRESVLRGWLLAPSVGLAVIVLLVLNLNQTGLPVQSFASWLTLGLALFAVGAFIWRRPTVPRKQLALFLGIAAVSLLYTCWPMFLYGFRWVGYMNGDMGIYCLGALRAMHYGFYRPPTVAELNGTDYSQYLWFHYAAGLFRCGADLFLAWLASVSHRVPLQITMPAMGALNLCQIFAAGALALTSLSKKRLVAIGACLLAVSPFFILGVMTQVAPQVGGITLLLALCTLCMGRFPSPREWKYFLCHGILVAGVSAALCIYYPEVIPFAVLAIVIFHGYQLLRRRENAYSVGFLGLTMLAVLVLVARQSIFTAIGTVLFAVGASVTKAGAPVPATDFDTILDPSAFASVFGLQTYSGTRLEPWISITILIGIILLAAAAVICVQLCLRNQPSAFLLLVMIGLGLELFFSHSAFGLFKLAMYIQPTMAFALGALAMRIPPKRVYIAPLLYLSATLPTAKAYILKSTDLLSSNAVSLPNVLESDIRAISLPSDQAVLMSTPNMVADYVFAGASIGLETSSADIDVYKFAETFTLPSRILTLPIQFGVMPNLLVTAQRLRELASFGQHSETFRGYSEKLLGQSIARRSSSNAAFAYLGSLSRDPWDSSNSVPVNDHAYFVFQKMADVENRMILLTTDKGGPHYRSPTISRWPIETDWFQPTKLFYAVGRHLLFEVVNPSPDLHLRVSLTRSLAGEGRTRLPESAIVDDAAPARLPFVGSGAANVISGPLQLFESNHHFYFALDFGIDGNYFPNHKTGLMRLFNVDIPADPRRIVGFARDISLVREGEIKKAHRPRSISSWPADLIDSRNVEFSGVYEDGWVSGRAFVVLGENAKSEKLHIKGWLPPIGPLKNGGNDLTILVNGKPVYERHLSSGDFQVKHTLTEKAGENRVDFKFSREVHLGYGDDRPVAARLLQVRIADSP